MRNRKVNFAVRGASRVDSVEETETARPEKEAGCVIVSLARQRVQLVVLEMLR